MTKADVLDFDTLDTIAAQSTPHEMELVHPTTKKPLGVFLNLVGPESPEFKARVAKEANRERRRAFEAKRKGAPVDPTTLEEDEAFGISLVADLVKGWRTVIDEGVVGKQPKSEPVIIWKGEKLAFTPENLSRWLTHFKSWVVPQINDFTQDLGNFLGN